MIQQLHLLRHAETIAPSGVLVGSTDVALSNKGVLQARELASKLPKDIVCLCSPLLRARQTLEHLQERGVALKATLEDRLREIDFGDFEMKQFAEIVNSGADIDGWTEYTSFVFPNGESVAGFTLRLKELLTELQEDGAEELLLLTHGGVVRTMICLALGLDVKNYLLFNVDYASWSTVEIYSDGGILTALNR